MPEGSTDEKGDKNTTNPHSIIKTICDSVGNLTGTYAPSADLVERVLRRGRILVIVDSPSEIDPETQKQIKQFPVNALIVTALDASDLVSNLPFQNTFTLLPLSESKIGWFFRTYLKVRGRGEGVEFSDEEIRREVESFGKSQGPGINIAKIKLHVDEMVTGR